MKAVKFLTTVLLSCGCILNPINVAARRFGRRSDLENVPPVSQYGLVVPLNGSTTCSNTTCITALPPPPAGKVLQYLSLARGINTYICTGQNPSAIPLFESQDTTLWDGAPLLPKLSNELQFHSLIPQLLDFNYAALKNSSLQCIGAIKSGNGESWVNLFNTATFEVNIQESVAAPVDPQHNLDWAHSTSTDLTWDVYRVETAGGTPPATCNGSESTIRMDYAAEYWFFQ